jgi:WD40 repeat protein
VFWNVANWHADRRIERSGCPFPSPVAYSPDGSRMALLLSPITLHLLDSETGAELARLEDPNEDRPSEFSFSPDGTQLIVTTAFSGTLHVWDLKAIRAELAGMQLDW